MRRGPPDAAGIERMRFRRLAKERQAFEAYQERQRLKDYRERRESLREIGVDSGWCDKTIIRQGKIYRIFMGEGDRRHPFLFLIDENNQNLKISSPF